MGCVERLQGTVAMVNTAHPVSLRGNLDLAEGGKGCEVYLVVCEQDLNPIS